MKPYFNSKYVPPDDHCEFGAIHVTNHEDNSRWLLYRCDPAVNLEVNHRLAAERFAKVEAGSTKLLLIDTVRKDNMHLWRLEQ